MIKSAKVGAAAAKNKSLGERHHWTVLAISTPFGETQQVLPTHIKILPAWDLLV